MPDAEESEMASQLTLMDVLRCAQRGAIFQAFLIKSLKEALVTEPIIGKMLYPIQYPRLTELQGENQYALGFRIHQHHFGFSRTGKSPDCLPNGKIKTTTTVTNHT